MESTTKILVTATKMPSHDEIVSVVRGVLRKHPTATISVADKDEHHEIARIASSVGAPIHFIYPDVYSIRAIALDTATSISVVSPKIPVDFNRFVIGFVQSVIAFDEGDPFVLFARRARKNIWFPRTGSVIRFD